MRLLITGGAGYIGGFTTRLLLRNGHDVTVVDDLSTGELAATGGAYFVRGDFADADKMRALLRTHRVEAVIHFAALKSVAESWRIPVRYHEVNVRGTASLLAAMEEVGVPLLVYSGTCAVYGAPVRLPVDETHPINPLNPYGQTKFLAEQAIRKAATAWGLRQCTLRYFNAAGAAADGSMGEQLASATNLVPIIMKAALRLRKDVPIYGTDYDTPDGTAVRDYVHVLDLAAAHVRALEFLAGGGASVTLNLGTGRGASVLELIAAAERATGRSISVERSARRDGDAPAIWADPSRAASVLGWRATRGIDDIVVTAWRWHSRQHRVAS